MKTKEEIELLAFKSYGDTLLKGSFIHGYTHCQQDNKDKKYTKEQIINAYWDAYKEAKYSTDKTADEYYKETFIT